MAGPTPPAIGDATKVVTGSFFIDDVDLNVSTTTPVLCCRTPLDNAANVSVDADIELSIFDLGSTGLAKDARIWVTTNGLKTLVYDQGASTIAGGWSIIETNSQSLSSGVDDISTFVLSHTADFISEETVLVEIDANSNDPFNLNTNYSFTIEDVTQPHLQSVKPFGLRSLKVDFTEAVQQDENPNSALCVRDISGTIKFTAPDTIEGPSGTFLSSDVDLFIGVAGAKNVFNNGAHQITSVVDSSKVTVSSTIVTEAAASPEVDTVPTVVVSCYRVVHVPPADSTIIEPAFEPIVIAAETVASSSVRLTLQDDLTPLVDYQLEAREIFDLSGNEVGSLIDFVSWTPQQVTNREFSLWDNFIPAMNKREDQTRDLERLIRCLDETTQVIINDIDQFAYLKDPDSIKESTLDVLLNHLGNPLSFAASLTTQRKRDLIPLLVPMYKQKGTEEGIVDAVEFFLAPNVSLVRVLPFWDTDNVWKLGESELGIDTILGAGSGFLRYAFEVEVTSSVALSDDERAIVEEIVEFVRPAHTHFVRLVEIVTP